MALYLLAQSALKSTVELLMSFSTKPKRTALGASGLIPKGYLKLFGLLSKQPGNAILILLDRPDPGHLIL